MSDGFVTGCQQNVTSQGKLQYLASTSLEKFNQDVFASSFFFEFRFEFCSKAWETEVEEPLADATRLFQQLG